MNVVFKFLTRTPLLLPAAASTPVAVPSWHYEESPEALAQYKDGKMPLGQALAKCYDLRTPKPDLLTQMWNLVPEAVKVS